MMLANLLTTFLFLATVHCSYYPNPYRQTYFQNLPKCRAPMVMNGLKVEPFKMFYDIGESISLSCGEGYELVQPAEQTCKRYRRGYYGLGYASFSDSRKPACRRKSRCYAPIKLKMTVSPRKKYYVAGESIELSCADGYELKGESRQTCEKDDRRWVGYSFDRFNPGMDNVMCKKKPSCRAPKSKGVGETVSVSCEEGYILKNRKESVCKETKKTLHWLRTDKSEGTFSPKIDSKICEKIPSCNRPKKQDGVILTPDKSYYEIRDKVDITCEEGYELRVAPSTTCTRTASTSFIKEGKFDPYVPSEICRKHISCTAPEGENFSVTPLKEKYEEGDEISVTCDRGYELEKKGTLTCERSTSCKGQKGHVSGCFYPILHKPVCSKLPSCKAPKNQEGLVISPLQEEYFVDEEINLSCEEGYELTMENSSTCEHKTNNHQTAIATWVVKKTGFQPKIKEGACKKLPEKAPEEDKDEEKDKQIPDSAESTEEEAPTDVQ